MFGNVTNPLNEHLPDLNAREYVTIGTLIALAFWIGVYPSPLFNVLEKPVHQIAVRYDPNYYSPQSARVNSTSPEMNSSASPAGAADSMPGMQMATPDANKDAK